MDDKPSSVPPLGKSLAPIITTGKKTADPAKIRETLSKYDQILNIINFVHRFSIIKLYYIFNFRLRAKREEIGGSESGGPKTPSTPSFDPNTARKQLQSWRAKCD